MEQILEFIKVNLLTLVLSFLLVIFIVCSGYIYYLYSNYHCPISECVKEKEVNETPKVFIDIKGSVNKSGVYQVDNDAIINDVIELAGGFTKNAYTKNINLSKKVSEELVIYVYSKSEYKKLFETTEKVVVEKECSSSDYNIDNCLDIGASIITNNNETITSNDNPTESNENTTIIKININTASKEELMTLNGIGESKAISIIEYRNTNGLFKNIEEIKNVSGIGDAAYEKIKNNITVE